MIWSDLDVSRETYVLLEAYVFLIEKWNQKINLVSQRTLVDIWERHIQDSIETARSAHVSNGVWMDMGTGGGLPGIVIAILAKQEIEQISQTVLIESDLRKSAFLSAVVRELDLEAKVVSKRIEKLPKIGANCISARALAPLPILLTYFEQHAADDAIGVFPKGRTWKDEVELARQEFSFDLEVISSVTQEGSVNLVVRNLTRG